MVARCIGEYRRKIGRKRKNSERVFVLRPYSGGTNNVLYLNRPERLVYYSITIDGTVMQEKQGWKF